MKFGTSSLVVAAFIGPGTVLTCAAAGVRYGYTLGWVLLFATAAVFVLQSFTAGTGILAGKGLGEALRESVSSPVRKAFVFGLVLLGLAGGCAAFEAGNLVGAAAGLQLLLGRDVDARVLVAGVAVLAVVLLMLNVRVLVRALSGMIAAMSILFVATFFLAPVDTRGAWRGLVAPTIPEGGLLTVVALIGTTIVTYNLFLHASVARRYWAGEVPRRAWRRELTGMALFLPVGGLVSYAILASGAALDADASVASVDSFARLLEPVAGPAATSLFGLGLFAAGLTSSITAPMAAAMGVAELMGWPGGADGSRYRAVWASVIAVGLFFSLTGVSPLQIIVAAQAANGMLLPIIAVFVLLLTRRQRILRLPRWYFALGALIVLVCAVLGARTLWWVWTVASGG